jgi:polysaccharide export outer membrane protein
MAFKGAVLCLFASVLSVAPVTGALGQQATPVNLGSPNAPASGNVAAGPGALQGNPGTSGDSLRYAIQRQDTLSLSFPFSPELNETVVVQPDGYVSLLNTKSVYAQGLTVPDLIGNIKKAYVGILEDPEVTVDVKDFQRPYFTVMGEVNKAGKYDLRTTLSVSEAIAVAGGLEPTAKTQVFLLHRDGDAGYQVQKLNLKEVFNGKKPDQDPTIMTGDMVYVPEKYIVKFKKYVPYSFNLGTYFQLANVP